MKIMKKGASGIPFTMAAVTLESHPVKSEFFIIN